jgi:putative ABC transport system permease protein
MLLHQWQQDLSIAGRGLRRAKFFTAAAVLTLALGITATTVMFPLIQGVLLRTPGYALPPRICITTR